MEEFLVISYYRITSLWCKLKFKEVNKILQGNKQNKTK